MHIYLDCVPCFVEQALGAARMVTDDEGVHERVVRRALRVASEVPFDRSPPEVGREIHRAIREESGADDPYAEVKRRFNGFALGLVPACRERIEASADPFAAAVRLAVAGNIIDFGRVQHLDEADVNTALDEAFHVPLAVDHIDRLRAAVESAGSILYLLDNAGEIVFDRLLIERLPTDRVTAAVRGGPIINDVTRDDAEAVGLTGIVPVIDNGDRSPGTILAHCSDAFRAAFDAADLVIAKGQGNYETLSDAGKAVFFLVKAKCPVIATDIGCDEGAICVIEKGA